MPVFQQILGRMKRHNRRPPAHIDIYMQGITEGNLNRVSALDVFCYLASLQSLVSVPTI